MKKFFGNFIFKIYNIFFSFLDSTQLNNKSLKYYDSGYKVFKIKKNFNFSKNNSEIKINKYLDKIIINEKKIYEVINEIFIKNNLKEKITKLTGLNYSIDYFVAYKTKKINKTVYCLVTEKHIIEIGNHIFGDWEDVQLN